MVVLRFSGFKNWKIKLKICKKKNEINVVFQSGWNGLREKVQIRWKFLFNLWHCIVEKINEDQLKNWPIDWLIDWLTCMPRISPRMLMSMIFLYVSGETHSTSPKVAHPALLTIPQRPLLVAGRFFLTYSSAALMKRRSVYACLEQSCQVGPFRGQKSKFGLF